jgi:hypothetical protein
LPQWLADGHDGLIVHVERLNHVGSPAVKKRVVLAGGFEKVGRYA